MAAGTEQVWATLTETSKWQHLYPSVEELSLEDGGATLSEGTKFEANLAGQDMRCVVHEFDTERYRLAWYAFPKASDESRCYHAWILTPSAKGTHIWTEETVQGPLWIKEAKKAPDIFWRTHEKLLAQLDSRS
ncbi:SRPBCC family protein [Dermacoccus barathri]|uniref:SRPBCC domain-containing protein n=3 Tax=Dermacoccaceae TaxID=145357 RepID=A0ABN2B9L4_9MICO